MPPSRHTSRATRMRSWPPISYSISLRRTMTSPSTDWCLDCHLLGPSMTSLLMIYLCLFSRYTNTLFWHSDPPCVGDGHFIAALTLQIGLSLLLKQDSLGAFSLVPLWFLCLRLELRRNSERSAVAATHRSSLSYLCFFCFSSDHR